MMGQSETLIRSQIMFIGLFSGGAQHCCAFYQSRYSVQLCWAKNQFPEPNRHILTCLHPILLCRITYWALMEMLLVLGTLSSSFENFMEHFLFGLELLTCHKRNINEMASRQMFTSLFSRSVPRSHNSFWLTAHRFTPLVQKLIIKIRLKGTTMSLFHFVQDFSTLLLDLFWSPIWLSLQFSSPSPSLAHQKVVLGSTPNNNKRQRWRNLTCDRIVFGRA